MLTGPHASDGRALITEAVEHLARGSTDEALAAALSALRKLAGNPAAAASAQLTVSAARLADGKPNEALARAEEALTAFKQAGDKPMEAAAMRTCANARIQLKEPADAVASAKNALAIFREIGDKEGEAATVFTLNNALAACEATANPDSAPPTAHSPVPKRKARKATAAAARACNQGRAKLDDLRQQLRASDEGLQDAEQAERRAKEELMRLSTDG